jgi:predicted ArsR family transcriptional regulator
MANRAELPATVQGVFGEPRGRLLAELCGHPQTAAELADRVGTSSNAVRVHLDGLRAAGLVQYEVARRGVGKPTHVYSITAAAEHLLSSAYVPTLAVLLTTLRHRLNGDFIPVLREAGLALAKRLRSRDATPAKRNLDAAMSILNDLGATAAIEDHGAERVLGTQCCPLAAITRETAEACLLMEELLSSASGRRMRERCERGAHPRCAFIVGPAVRS